MALNKAQLMETPGGPGVVGAVKSGNGISVSPDGSISINAAQTITKVTAGTGISVNPSSGLGDVTISVNGSAGGVVTKLIAGSNVTLSPTSGTGDVTISASGGGGGGAVNSVSGTGNGISVNPTTGAVVVQNTGVTRINAGSNITVSGNTGEITISSSGGGTSPIPSGTIMLFLQGSAPTGWTQVNNDYEDRALRLIGGGGGGSTAGSGGFLQFMNGTYSFAGGITLQDGNTGPATLSEGQLAAHGHQLPLYAGPSYVAAGVASDNNVANATTSPAGGNQSHAHPLGGVTCQYGANARFDVKIINVIACQKQ